MTTGEREYELSVVVPAFNEAARIPEPLRRIDRHIRARGLAAELLVVDDGSTDGTAEVVRRIAAELTTPVRVLTYAPNRGKGYAVKVGMAGAWGRAVLVTDADLSTPIEDLDALLPALRDGTQVVIGSRRMEGAVIALHQPLVREWMGRVFTWLAGLLGLGVSDVTCGFKLFSREAAERIFSRVTLADWSFDAEALFVARRLGYEIREVPVHWRDVAGTKVQRMRDAWRSALGLARILLNTVTGRYRLRAPH